MRLLYRLEQRLRPYAVPNLTVVLIVCQALAWLMMIVQPGAGLWERFALLPSAVLEGEVWRLITFLALPPPFGHDMFGIIFTLFFWNIFYLMGTALEHVWGAFRYNIYLLIWYVATISTSFIAPDLPTTNIFLGTSVFLAFAYLFPEFELRLFLILPVKVKWLGLLTWIMLGISLVSLLATMQWGGAIAIAASLANFFIFLGRDLYEHVRLGRRRVARKASQIRRERSKPTYHHRCTVCGKTDASDPDEDFRYCSQCTGQQAYCSEHLRDHEHVREGESG